MLMHQMIQLLWLKLGWRDSLSAGGMVLASGKLIIL
jgi:hypothetical protein